MDHCVLAFDLGGTNIRGAVVSHDGHLLNRMKTATGNDPLKVLLSMSGDLMQSSSVKVHSIGIAIAGILDRQRGIVLNSPNIAAFRGVCISEILRERFGIPVFIENDANAAALGERVFGAGKAYHNFIMLTLGTGIGCGIVIDGSLLEIAAEAGHITIHAGGRLCGCGNLGCFEAYASATAVIKEADRRIKQGEKSIFSEPDGVTVLTAQGIYEAALAGDGLSRKVLVQAGTDLGIGIGSLANIFDPEAVILGGGLAGAEKFYIESAKKSAKKRSLREICEKCTIIVSKLGDDAGILGAAALAMRLEQD